MTKFPNAIAERSYEERYCAFVDILGFSDLINRLREGTTKFESLRSLLRKIHEPIREVSLDINKTDFRAQSISDAVALSTAANEYGLSQLFYSLESLTLDLLYEGFFVRGAIVKGPLYHDDKMVFGEALVRAFKLERDTVRFPRVMIAREAVNDARLFPTSYAARHIQQAEDGPFFMDVLKSVGEEVRTESAKNPDLDASESEDLNYFVNMRNTIQRRFHEAVDNPRHFEKVQWFAAYWLSR